MNRHLIALMALVLAGALICLDVSAIGTANAQRTCPSHVASKDSSNISGEDIRGGSGDEDFFDEDIPSALRQITHARDTLHTYTLSGHRVRKQESGHRARIIIRNGRKVVKR